jgi:hypothetical protein
MGHLAPRPRAHQILAGALTLAVLLVATIAWSLAPPTQQATAAYTTNALRTVTPCRLADTRDGRGVEAPSPDRIRVQVAGRCGVPDTATAAVLTVTVTRPQADGFATVWPAATALPTASTVNFRAGEDRANGAIVALAAGAIDATTSVPADVVVDVTGWFEPVMTSTSGRFAPMTPTRAFDSRSPSFGRPLAAGETVRVPLPDGVPPDATALAVNVTTTDPNAPGYVTLHPWGTDLPEASSLNTDGADQTRAAAAIAPVEPDGLAVYAHAGGHVIVDVTGWFTGPSAGESSTGLFVPTPAPQRVIDTRTGDPVWDGGGVEIPVGMAGASAVALNVTLVDAHAWGFLTAHAARTPVPGTSTVNASRKGDTAANMALVPVSSAGVQVDADGGADLVADLAGWFVGDPVPPNTGPPANARPPVCARGTSVQDLNAFFAAGDPIKGADYQRTYPLPDGRTLWLFQDVQVVSRGGTRFVHNAGLVQSGACFTLLQGGSYVAPAEYLLAAQTVRWSRWYWPLGGDIGADGNLHVFVAELRGSGRDYLDNVEPIATYEVTIDPVTLAVREARPAVDSTSRLYGWSVTSDASYTYLYAHCYRQFGFDPLWFSDPPVDAHDWDCTPYVTVARVPRGRFDQPPRYWNGATWGTDPNAAVAVIPTAGRMVNPTQVRYEGGRFIAVTKEGDWWGDTIYLDVAPTAAGPFTTYATLKVTPRCADCNTYFASFLPGRVNGRLQLGLSNNSFEGPFTGWYSPTFLTAPAP